VIKIEGGVGGQTPGGFRVVLDFFVTFFVKKKSKEKRLVEIKP